MLFCKSYRLFARRCHLTEQIGARRRELYANDIFIPLDDEVVWNYNSRPAKIASNDVANVNLQTWIKPEIAAEVEAASEPSIMPISETSNTDTGELREAYLRASRLLDIQRLRCIEKMCKSAEMIVIYSELQKVAQQCDYGPIQPDDFLEEYLMLFQRFQVSDILDKLYSSGVLPTIEMASLDLSYQTLSVPLPSDILALQECISKLNLSKLGVQVFPLVRFALFLHHPLIMAFTSRELKADASAELANPNPLSKQEVKELAQSCFPPNSRYRSLVNPLLLPTWTSPDIVYRLHLLSRYVPESGKLDSLVSPFSETFARFSKMNSDLKVSLFPLAAR